MPRPKRISFTQEIMAKNASSMSKQITLIDATMPYDNATTNNQVCTAIRETRVKLNEIINALNLR